ncbi:MAG: peptide chain release factor N(5)-glutamine methyltransferase [Verrucomicrobia bacterium]|nr:peptide chain release factor N(5)-glutamine methyltransferase [Verrucomicrobiota bacterium]
MQLNLGTPWPWAWYTPCTHSPLHPVVTVLEILQSTTAYFAQRGIESPRLNIEHLLADALGKRRLDLYLEFDRTVSEHELGILRAKVRRRAEREPLQHVLGHWDFFGRRFKTDRRALIPRPETELLVEEALIRLPGTVPGRLAIDVGTGSGVIGITLALERPDLQVVGIDQSEQALALASENASLHQVTSRVRFAAGDLLSSIVPEPAADLIVANLPYIPTAQIAGLAAEVRRDPVAALDGGPDGLQLIRRLIRDARFSLKPGGFLALEIGAGQAAEVGNLLAAEKYRDIFTRKDYQGVIRVVGASYG